MTFAEQQLSHLQVILKVFYVMGIVQVYHGSNIRYQVPVQGYFIEQ